MATSERFEPSMYFVCSLIYFIIQYLCPLKQQDLSNMEHFISPESHNSFYDSVVCYTTSMSKYLIKSNTEDLS